jgi:hypothetical protein
MPVAPAAAEFKTICQYARRGWGYKQIAGALKLSVEYVAAVLA